jgi:hypothetical protein
MVPLDPPVLSLDPPETRILPFQAKAQFEYLEKLEVKKKLEKVIKTRLKYVYLVITRE